MELYEIINWVLLGLTAFFALIGALKGLSRGAGRQTVRFLTIIASVILSFMLARMLGSMLFAKLESMTIEELIGILVTNGIIGSAEDLKILTYFDTVTLEYILAIPMGLVILPILFAVMFPIISALMLIVHAIVSGILGFTKKKNNWFTRLIGMGIGAVQGVLVTAVILVPIIGIVNTAGGAIEAIGADAEDDSEIITIYSETVLPVKEGPVFKTVSTFGGQLIYEMLASVKLEGNRVNMTEQVDTVVDIYGNLGELGELDLGNLTEENKAALDSMIESIKTSDYFSPLLANIVSGLSKFAKDGEMVSTMEEPLKTLLIDIFTVMETSTVESIGQDIDTFKSLLYLLSDSGLLASGNESGEGEDMLTILSKTDAEGKTVISKAIEILSANERTKSIVSSLTKIALSTMTEGLGAGVGEEIEQVFDSVKNGMSELIQINPDNYATENEYRDAVAESLNDTLIANDIQLTTDVVRSLADHVVDNYSDLDEISDEEVTLLILEYFSKYASGEEPLPEEFK